MVNKMKSVGIVGMGCFIPENFFTNYDLEKIIDTSHDWIIKRTGISKRHKIDDNMPAYRMGVQASKIAIKNSNLQPEDIDLIITTSYTPDYFLPSMACLIQSEIGASKASAFDLNAACSGYIYGLITAQQFIQSGYYKNVLVVSVEAQTRLIDWTDRNSCILFGDGAAATLLSEVPEGYGILSSHLGADGSSGNVLTAPCLYISEEEIRRRNGKKAMTMWLDGSDVMKFAVRAMVSSTHYCLQKAEKSLSDVALIVPHQANIRIIEGATKRLEISSEKVYTNIEKYGNMSSASIPVAFFEAINEGLVKDGDNIVFVGFGGGLTWGSILIKWHKAT
jgi:3-oxoacyl-[acyl-carrier-protein] synthase-3